MIPNGNANFCKSVTGCSGSLVELRHMRDLLPPLLPPPRPPLFEDLIIVRLPRVSESVSRCFQSKHRQPPVRTQRVPARRELFIRFTYLPIYYFHKT